MSNKNYALEANQRDGAGKGIARALRRSGRTPAVIYGDKKEPVLIDIDSNTINVEYNRGQMFTTLCDVDVAGDKSLVLARDIQLHPVTDVVEHVDFLRVTAKTKIAVSIPVHFTHENASPGLDQGGILSVIRFDVELNCSATSIPEAVEISLEGKDIGDSLKMSDADLPDGVTPVIDDRDFTLATIEAPKAVVEEETDEEAAEGEEGAEGSEEGGDTPAEGGEEASE